MMMKAAFVDCFPFHETVIGKENAEAVYLNEILYFCGN